MTVDVRAPDTAVPQSRVSRVFALGWLTGPRIMRCGCVVLALYAAVLLVGVFPASGVPNRVDYIAFHAATAMALAGDASGAYAWDRLIHLQAATLGIGVDQVEGFLGWVYPPHFFFYVVPFGLLPYGWGWLAWVLAGVGLLGFAIRTALPDVAGPAIVATLCTPAVVICAGLGQNGLLTAALMCWGFALMDRRPAAAGLAFGLLTVKPQFGLLLPLLLVATGRWRVFAVAAMTAAVLALASVFAFGLETWQLFLAAVARNNELFLSVPSPALRRIQSIYALVLTMTGNRAVAWAIHGAVGGGAALLALRLWLRRPEGPMEARSAAAMAASFLLTPFTWLYDAPALAVAALFLVQAGRRDGFLEGEKLLLVLACGSVAQVFVLPTHSLVVPSAWLLILALAWRRDRAFRLSQAPSGSPCAGT